MPAQAEPANTLPKQDPLAVEFQANPVTVKPLICVMPEVTDPAAVMVG